MTGGQKRAGVMIHRLETPRDVKEELEDFLDESGRGVRGKVFNQGTSECLYSALKLQIQTVGVQKQRKQVQKEK